MSGYHNILLLFPPKTNSKEEVIEVSGFVCPECNGKKIFTTQTGHNEWKTTNCSYCEGTGRVKASVRICWLPDEENNKIEKQ
jgi:hypothetical protein